MYCCPISCDCDRPLEETEEEGDGNDSDLEDDTGCFDDDENEFAND